MRQALIIFARPPQLGKVKTRLAAQIGDEQALAVYIKLLEHTRSIAQVDFCQKYVFATEPFHDGFWDGFFVEQQSEGDLGERMHHAFQYLFGIGFQRVVIIGSDCPDLSSDHIRDAFDALEGADIVIGPAKDGGYYLIGMSRLRPEIFQGKSWSTHSVLKETIDTVIKLRLFSVHLPTLTDVDEVKDLPELWKQELGID